MVDVTDCHMWACNMAKEYEPATRKKRAREGIMVNQSINWVI
jgi:hypothetical protein